MPYREKVAWLSLLAMADVRPVLRTDAAGSPGDTMPNLEQLGRFGVTAVAQMLMLGAGHLWLRHRRSGGCARAGGRAGSRDQAPIGGMAYYVLIAGMILVGCVMPFCSSGWTLINTAIVMIVLAELVHYGVAVWSYRRGWHD